MSMSVGDPEFASAFKLTEANEIVPGSSIKPQDETTVQLAITLADNYGAERQYSISVKVTCDEAQAEARGYNPFENQEEVTSKAPKRHYGTCRARRFTPRIGLPQRRS